MTGRTRRHLRCECVHLGRLRVRQTEHESQQFKDFLVTESALFFCAIFFAIVCGKWATAWDRPFWSWFVAGFFAGPIPLLFLFFSKPSTIPCPSCRSLIPKAALVCSKCQRDVVLR